MSPKFPGKAVNWLYVNSCFDKTPQSCPSCAAELRPEQSELQEITPNHHPHHTGDPGFTDLIQNPMLGGRREAGNHCSSHPSAPLHPKDTVPAQQNFPARAAQDAQLSSKGIWEQQVFSLEKSWAIAELPGAGGKGCTPQAGHRANPTEPQRKTRGTRCFSSGLAEFKPLCI